MTKRNRDIVAIIGIIAIVGFAIIFMYGIVHGSNVTNSTNEMIFGDRFNCGYINTTTTLEDIRDCYRD